jgi:hypothetical protein
MDSKQLLQKISNPESIILPVLTLFFTALTITLSLSNPVQGFIATTTVLLTATILRFYGRNNRFIPTQEISNHQETLLFWTGVTALAFIPMLFPQLQLGIGIAILGYAALIYLEKEQQLTEEEFMKLVWMGIAAILFFFLFLFEESFILGVIAGAAFYLWELTPEKFIERLGI